MESYKKEFIEFMVESDVLKFGEFTLKSGRKSPFFMNAGAYVTGSQLKRLGEYYAKAIHEHYGDDFDVLFGPAYKGIPLSVTTAIAYSELYGKEIRYCSLSSLLSYSSPPVYAMLPTQKNLQKRYFSLPPIILILNIPTTTYQHLYRLIPNWAESTPLS